MLIELEISTYVVFFFFSMACHLIQSIEFGNDLGRPYVFSITVSMREQRAASLICVRVSLIWIWFEIRVLCEVLISLDSDFRFQI